MAASSRPPLSATTDYRAPRSVPLASRRWFKQTQRLLGRDWPTAYLFVGLTVLLLATIKAYPFLKATWYSFHRVIGFQVGAFVGLDNYVALWGDDRFTRAIGTTLTFTVISVLAKLILGMSASLLLHNVPRWGAVFGGLLLVPFIVPDVVRALAWRLILDPIFGGLNYLLVNVLGIFSKGVPWLSDPSLALPSVITVNVWAGTPFIIIMLVAGLKSIDGELYDAASVDGAGAWRRYLHITLPGLRYVLLVGTLGAFIATFNGFTLVYLLTSGGPYGATRMYPILAVEYAVLALRTSAGIAVAMMVAPVMLALSLIMARYLLWRDEIAGGTHQDGVVWRGLMGALWPVRVAIRGLLALFWAINDCIERAVEAIGRTVQSLRGGKPDAPGLLAGRPVRRVGLTLMYATLGAIVLFELFPIYFVVITAFKTELQIQRVEGMFWPEPWTLEQFTFLFRRTRFLEWYRNTTFVAISTTLISLLAASLGAYAMVRLRWRGASALATAVMVANLMPGALMVIPMYLILSQLALINTHWALLMTYPTFVLPFATWMMMGYYRSIPEEIEDAAMIDGCNRLQAFFLVVLPLVRPALLAVALLAFTASWNEFLYAFTFLRSRELYTLPVGLSQLIVGDIQPWGLLMAASLLTAVPVAMVYIVAQRLMVAGLTAGSLKG